MIVFDQVSYTTSNQKNIFNKISFKISKGDFICIYGANGSGKTTLSYLLSGHLKPSSGNILFENETIDYKLEINILKQKIGLVFQNSDDQFIYDTVKRDLGFSLENKNKPYEEIKTLVENIIQKFSLEELADLKIAKLSGGQKQKVAIAEHFLDAKDIIIFDESFSMLDYDSISILNEIFQHLNNEGKTVILITHNLLEIPYGYKWKYFKLSSLIRDIEVFENTHFFLNNIKASIFDPMIKDILQFQIKNNYQLTLDESEVAKQIKDFLNNGNTI